MSRKIVGMLTSYPGEMPTDWLWQQSPQPFGIWGNMQIQAKAVNPDFLLLYNFTEFPSLNPSKSGFWRRFRPAEKQRERRQEEIRAKLQRIGKERIISLVREPPFEERKASRIAEYQLAQLYCGYVSGPDDFAPIPEYMPAIWYHSNSFRELDEMPSPEKVRSCCWITSGISRTAEHRQRLAFLRLLTESNLEFDVYGRDLPAWAGSLGKVGNKWNAMSGYYYNLAIENYALNDWYVSEKLWDALLAWCLPIYYGGSAADKILPPGSFLRLPSRDEKGLAYIQEVISSPDAWHEAKNAIAEARQIILHELNLLKWLSDLIDKLN